MGYPTSPSTFRVLLASAPLLAVALWCANTEVTQPTVSATRASRRAGHTPPIRPMISTRDGQSRRPATRLAIEPVVAATAKAMWSERFDLPPVWDRNPAIYDSARKRVLLFGGTRGCYPTTLCDYWTWDSVRWVRETATRPLPKLWISALAYEAKRGEVLAIGRTDVDRSDVLETWVFRDTGWSKAEGQLPVLDSFTLSSDPERGTVVLFGGFHRLSGTDLRDVKFSDETYEWQGATWVLKHPATRPPTRSYAQSAYDPVRASIVMHGGFRLAENGTGCSVFLRDTWTWDGTTWRQVPSEDRPEARSYALMDFDPVSRQMLLFGGREPGGGRNVTTSWTLDGQNWRKIATTGAPLGCTPETRLVRNPKGDRLTLIHPTSEDCRTVAVQEMIRSYTFYDWTGSGWQASRVALPPALDESMLLAYHSRRRSVVLLDPGRHGSPTMLWEWKAGSWGEMKSDNSPPEARERSLSYDEARNEVVSFGASLRSKDLKYRAEGFTWTWTDSGWVRRETKNSPAPRSDSPLVYDPVRKRTLIFGGRSDGDENATVLGDTWEWDGTDWEELHPVHAPEERSGHSLCYDPSTHRVLLFGGRSGQADSGFLGDLWEWNGTDWKTIPAANPPPPRARSALIYAPSLRAILLYGGTSSQVMRHPTGCGTFGVSGGLRDQWTFDGHQWAPLPVAAAAPPARTPACVADPETGRIFVIAGYRGICEPQHLLALDDRR